MFVVLSRERERENSEFQMDTHWSCYKRYDVFQIAEVQSH